MVEKRTYKYSVSKDNEYVDVEMAGRFSLNEGEDPKEKAKAVIVSTQQVAEDIVDLKKVDDVQSGVITSNQPAKKR